MRFWLNFHISFIIYFLLWRIVPVNIIFSLRIDTHLRSCQHYKKGYIDVFTNSYPVIKNMWGFYCRIDVTYDLPVTMKRFTYLRHYLFIYLFIIIIIIIISFHFWCVLIFFRVRQRGLRSEISWWHFPLSN